MEVTGGGMTSSNPSHLPFCLDIKEYVFVYVL